MDPILLAQLRRQWVPIAAIVVFLGFLVAHLTLFQPAMKRYEGAVRRAAGLGLDVGAIETPRLMPAMVSTLLTENSLPAATAEAQGASGELAAGLLEEVAALASKHGMDVAETQPGATTQFPRAVQVRAHMRMICSYAEFVAFLDDLNRSGRLISIDRFSLSVASPGRHMLDLWVTRYVIKQNGARS